MFRKGLLKFLFGFNKRRRAMKKKIRIMFFLGVLALATGLFLPGIVVSATIIGGPGPAGYGSDDGSKVFSKSDFLVGLELFDTMGDLGFASYFGFYNALNPSDSILIFDESDQGGPQSVFVDFIAGVVWDVDKNELQSSFVPFSQDIGFFLGFYDGSINTVLFTDPDLNGGIDYAATYPSLTDPGQYVIGFEIFSNGTFIPISSHLLTNVNPVPVPAALVLFASGLLGIAGYRRKSKHC